MPYFLAAGGTADVPLAGNGIRGQGPDHAMRLIQTPSAGSILMDILFPSAGETKGVCTVEEEQSRENDPGSANDYVL